MTNIYGLDNMIILNNSAIYIYNENLQNCSALNFTIFIIHDSKFYLENSHFKDFPSPFLYSDYGFIKVENCIFDNFNSTNLENLENECTFFLENKVLFIFNKNIFQNLNNFAKVIVFFLK